MSTSVERMRRHRDRKKRGVVAIVPIEVDILAVSALMEEGYLDLLEADYELNVADKTALVHSIQGFLDDWSIEVADRVLGDDRPA